MVNIGRHVNSSQKFELDPTVTCSHITSGSYSQGDIQRHLRVLTLESDAFSTKNGKEQWHEHHPTCVKFVQPNHVGGDWPTPQVYILLFDMLVFN